MRTHLKIYLNLILFQVTHSASVCSMKLFSASVCSLVLVCSLAVANFSGITYCIEKVSGRLCTDPASELLLSLERCCSFEQSQDPSKEASPLDCEHCTDIEIDGSDSELGLIVERVGLQAPVVQVWVSADIIPARNGMRTFQTMPGRAPPIYCRASKHYADTIQFRI